MLRLRLVNESNFEDVVDLSVSRSDERRLAPNAYSLAQAWLYRDSGEIFPYAVEVSNQVVGFVLLWKKVAFGEYFIWRLMIDQQYQNKGYGNETLRQIIQMATSDVGYDTVTASYVMGNHRMRGMLSRLGFEMVGVADNEITMALHLNEKRR